MPLPTEYDDEHASDGRGGPHPLAGVPQAALDAALKALKEASIFLPDHNGTELTVLDANWNRDDTMRPIAESILAAALEATKRVTGTNPYQPKNPDGEA